MREMNVILADIVTANGGTVTPPITRNGLLSDWLEAITPTIIQQVFITLNGVDEYFTFQNTKTFPDDFDLSIDAVLPTAATTVTLFGQTASADHYIKVLSTGFVSINIDTSIVTSTVLATKDSKQRRYGVKLVGNDFIFTEDGATIDTVTDAVAAAKTLIINAIGQSNGADFFNNTLSDPILKDLTTPSNSVSWQLNRALPATTEQSSSGDNLLTYVGAPKTELFTFNQSEGKWRGSVQRVVNGGFDIDTSSWDTKNSVISSVNGQLVIDDTLNAGGDSAAFQQVITQVGSTYRFEFDFISSTTFGQAIPTGSATASGGDSGPFPNLTVPNHYTLDYTAVSDSYVWFVTAGDGISIFDNVSVKRIIQIA